METTATGSILYAARRFITSGTDTPAALSEGQRAAADGGTHRRAPQSL